MAPKMRRPAAAAARVRPLRRPARAEAEEGHEEEKPPTEEYNTLASLTMERLRSLDIVEFGETSYYGGHAKVSGRIRKLMPAEEEVEVELTGTMSDRVLERFGGGGSRLIQVHVCQPGCTQLTTGDTYMHSRGYWDCSVAPKPWHTNLIPAKAGGEAEVDELAGLREMAMERGKGREVRNLPNQRRRRTKVSPRQARQRRKIRGRGRRRREPQRRLMMRCWKRRRRQKSWSEGRRPPEHCSVTRAWTRTSPGGSA